MKLMNGEGLKKLRGWSKNFLKIKNKKETNVPSPVYEAVMSNYSIVGQSLFY